LAEEKKEEVYKERVHWQLHIGEAGRQFRGYIESAGFIRVALFVTFFESTLIDAGIEMYFADDLSRIGIHDDD